jgi:hypothetical protein
MQNIPHSFYLIQSYKSLGIRLIIVFFIVVTFITCNRDILDPDPSARPEFSTDTVTFDTVFTSIGSTTLSFRIYNRSNRPLLINSISLAEGDNSFFRLNIDGEPALHVNNVEIPPDDSLFVFVAVTVDPTNRNNPVIIRDSVLFNTRGELQDVKLIAYGQDVHLIDGEIISSAVWTNDKPYLIYNSVAVDSGEILQIQEGTQIYFHRNSSMIVWGTLIVEGTFENPVVFRNDRLEEFYDIVAGQWGTLYFDPMSTGNRLNHAIIRNAIAGIQIGYPSDYRIPDVEISNCQIINVSFAGIYAFGAEILCYNTIIANSAGPAIALLRGGNYRFYHCTISNNGVPGASRANPSVVITNTFNNPEYDESLGDYVYLPRSGDLEMAGFFNSIIYGNFPHEIQLVDNATNLFEYRFDHCILKAVEDSINDDMKPNFASVIFNEDPNFANDSDRYHLDYRLDTLSPAKDSGDMLLPETFPFLQQDMTGESRVVDESPDLGAFERKED